MLEAIIDWPARQIGSLIPLAYIVASMTASIGTGAMIARRVPPKELPQFGAAIGIAVGVYIAAVLWRSQHWAAIALLSSMKD
ncbi:hypothetical protein [Rhizobium sp. CAU 1783]